MFVRQVCFPHEWSHARALARNVGRGRYFCLLSVSTLISPSFAPISSLRGNEEERANNGDDGASNSENVDRQNKWKRNYAVDRPAAGGGLPPFHFGRLLLPLLLLPPFRQIYFSEHVVS